MELPRAMVPHVVGQDGEALKKIERSSGVHINIDTKDGMFKLHINGARKSIEYAQSLIFDAMEQAAFNDPGANSGGPPTGQGWGTNEPSWGTNEPPMPPMPPMAPGCGASQWPEPSSANYHAAGAAPWHSGDYAGNSSWPSAEHRGDHGNAMLPPPPMYGQAGGSGPWHGYAPPEDFHKRKRDRSSSSSSSSSERRRRKAKKELKRAAEGRQDSGQAQQQASWGGWPQAAQSGWPQWGAYAAAAAEIDQDEL